MGIYCFIFCCVGVRVVPEIDTPGHSYSWRFADSTTQIVSQCPAAYSANINNFPLDPSKERTYEVIQEVWKQIGKVRWSLISMAYVRAFLAVLCQCLFD